MSESTSDQEKCRDVSKTRVLHPAIYELERFTRGRQHRLNLEKFYELLIYKDDVDLTKKLQEWERYHNYNRPHGAFKAKHRMKC